MKILLLLLTLTASAFAQSYHLQTNIVQVPCISYHYYGIRPDGGITSLGQVEDHNAQPFEHGAFEPQFTFIIRSEKPVQLTTVTQPHQAKVITLPPMPNDFYPNATNGSGGTIVTNLLTTR